MEYSDKSLRIETASKGKTIHEDVQFIHLNISMELQHSIGHFSGRNHEYISVLKTKKQFTYKKKYLLMYVSYPFVLCD